MIGTHHAVEVVAPLDQSSLLRSDLGQAVAELFLHALGVVAEVDWVCEPADPELKATLAGCFVVFAICVPWILFRLVSTRSFKAGLSVVDGKGEGTIPSSRHSG